MAAATYRLPILGVVPLLLPDLLDLFGLFELLLGRFGQHGRTRLDKLHRIVGHFGGRLGGSRRDVLGRS